MKHFIYKNSILAVFFAFIASNISAQTEEDGLAPYWRTKGNVNVSSPSVPATYGTTKILSTEHWLGTVGNKDLVIGTDSIERMRVKGTGNVGIGTANPLTTLDVKGGLAIESGSVIALNTGANALTIGNNTYIKVTSTTALPSEATVTFSNGLQNGQILIFEVQSAGNAGVKLINTANLNLVKSPQVLNTNSTTQFIWDATINKWVEIGHNTPLPYKAIYTYTGAPQVFVVPVGVTKINVKLWGAGGGASYYSTGTFANDRFSSGGSGGYVEGTLSVTPLQAFQIIVGKAGSSNGGERITDFSGAASGGGPISTTHNIGGGGGYSAIADFTFSTVYALAGGGGGAGGRSSTNCNSTYVSGLAFGGGGGSTGTTLPLGNGGNGGSPACSANAYGRGGTQSAGGAGGTGSFNAGEAGSAFAGGLGGDGNSAQDGGGGGGGGYYGGGGGHGGFPTGNNYYAGGGGGGSSYFISGGGHVLINSIRGGTTNNGTAPAIPNSADTDLLSDVCQGGYGAPGFSYFAQHGEVVISW